MKVIGLTGGIGSGKSTVTEYLKTLDIHVIDADQIGRQVVEVGKPALEEIRDAFGEEVLLKDGSLNREALGEIVFASKDALAQLNSITLNKIKDEINMQLEKCTKPIVFIDAAILIETNLHELVDEVWLISISESLQIKRVKERNQMDERLIKDRIDSQMTNKSREKYAHVVIENEGSIEELYRKVKKEVERLMKVL